MSQIASRLGSECVVCVDELHNLHAKDMADLSGSIQELVAAEGMDLHFRGAALPFVKFRSLSSVAQSFFKRCTTLHVEPLTQEEVAAGLGLYAESAGGSFTDEALQLAAEQSWGSPYRMQLIGQNAWRVSDSPSNPIALKHVEYALTATNRKYRDDVENPTLKDFDQVQQNALMVVYNSPPGTSSDQIKRRLADREGIILPQAQQVLNDLLDANILDETEQGELVFVEASGMTPRFQAKAFSDVPRVSRQRVVLAEASVVPSDMLVAATTTPALNPAADTDAEVRCGKWMPRARARCVRRLGHPGACRSR